MNQQVYQQMLGTLGMPASADAPLPTTETLLEQLGESNPQIKLLAQYMAQRQAAAEKNDEDDTDQDDQAAQLAAAQQQATKRLRRMVNVMYAELKELRQRNDALADALGACYLCWGEDPACEVCGGTGQPGSEPSDAALFAQYVAPAVQRRRTQLTNERRTINDRSKKHVQPARHEPESP